MKKCSTGSIALRHILAVTAVIASLASCKKDELVQNRADDEVIITATASLGQSFTKVIYEDHSDEGKGILSGWKTGDTFLALEVNGSTVTPVTFTATAPADEKTTFTSSGAVAADAQTTWVGVFGKNASFAGSDITMNFSGQNGTVKNLEKYDYILTQSTGTEPDFTFGSGRHVTHLIKMNMPEGVKSLEFNSSRNEYDILVSSNGDIAYSPADYHAAAVKNVILDTPTKKGQAVYLAVPAIDYREAGLIVTFFNSDKTKSQGKVESKNLKTKGGKMGTSDFSEMPLIDRPLASDGIDFMAQTGVLIKKNPDYASYSGVSDIYNFKVQPVWAPFNLGAKSNPEVAEDFYGDFFAWGETEPKESYSWDGYKHNSDHATIGYIRDHIGNADVTLSVQTISGTKYDAARVKWGTEWRMPALEEMLTFVGNNDPLNVTTGRETETDAGFYTRDVTTYKNIEVKGRTFIKNGREVFLPFCGRCSYTEGGQSSGIGQATKMGYYYCGAHNLTSGSKEAYRLMVRGNQIEGLSQEAGFGFSIRPVLASTSAENPEPARVIGHVSDKSTGRGISGVIVSDGYTATTTDSEGAYALDANTLARTINFTVPAAYEIPLDAEGKPAFYKKVNLSKVSGDTVVDMEFTPRSNVSNDFSLVVFADAHIQNDSNLNRFKNESIPDIQNTVNELFQEGNGNPVIGISLGDQMWDNMKMSDGIKAQVTSLKAGGKTMPFFYCIGNHDHQSGVGKTDIDATNYFVNNFGPTDYSFDIGKAHIVVADDIDYNGNDEIGSDGYTHIKYAERLSGEKLHWLRQDLAAVQNPKEKIVIFCTHSPVYNGLGGAEQIKKELRIFSDALVLTGHIHNMFKSFFSGYSCASGRTEVEHNIQSLCGMWWLADLSPNGTPAGYKAYTIKGNSVYSEYNKVTKANKKFQMRAYSGNDSYSGYYWKVGSYTEKEIAGNGKFLVRIWDGDGIATSDSELTWKVYFEKDGVKTLMNREKRAYIDKCAGAYIKTVLKTPYGTNDNAASISWWTIDAPCGDPAAETGWKIVAEHSLPSGWKQTYEVTSLSRDFTGYGKSESYPITY